ncbi:hypothetical protein X975_09296, partial [Stegodyphus mimosarum]
MRNYSFQKQSKSLKTNIRDHILTATEQMDGGYMMSYRARDV